MLTPSHLTQVCLILVSQIETLNEAYRHSHGLAVREEEGTEAYERFSRLALRAQAQTARTASVLGRLSQLPGVTQEPPPPPPPPPEPLPPIDVEVVFKPEPPRPYGCYSTLDETPPRKVAVIQTPPDGLLARLIVWTADYPWAIDRINGLLADKMMTPEELMGLLGSCARDQPVISA